MALNRSLYHRVTRSTLSALLALAFAAACDNGPTDLRSPGFEPQMAPGGSTSLAPLTVHVTDGTGANVAGAFVRVVAAAGLRTDLPLTDVNGNATATLPTGDYCVSVRLTPPSAMAEPVIVPDDVSAGMASELPKRTDLAPMVVTKNGAAAFTATGWADCLSKAPTKHNGSSTTIDVVMTPSAFFSLSLLGPNGQSLFQTNPNLDVIAGYAITAVPTGSRRPAGFSFDPDLKDGFLQFVDLVARGPSPRDLAFGVAPNQAFQVEFQQSSTIDGRTVNYTGTIHVDGGPAGDNGTLGELIAEPLYCNQTYQTYPTLTSFASINFGYMADPRAIVPGTSDLTRVLLPNLTVIPMEIVLAGNQSYTASFREDLVGGSRLTTDLSFTCTADSCTETSQKTSGGSGHIIFAFFRPLSATGKIKATLFLTGLTADNDVVTFAVKAAGTGEGVPQSSKKNATAAFVAISKPAGTSCPVRNSNDDKWFVD
jgi:hypothetical protein